MTLYSSYTPDFKCITDGNGKGIVNANVGLITYDEVVYAGSYYGKNNSNYYLYNNDYFWTMSPASFSGSYSYVWRVNATGNLYDRYVADTSSIHPVLNLRTNVMVTGTGTSSDPFVVE